VCTKKIYIKPSVTLIYLDKSVSLMMQSNTDPWETTGGNKGSKKGTDDPFASPFGDKPFN
jgi:hypothetical protein